MDQFFAVKLDNGSSVEIKAQAELGLKPHDLCIFRREFYTDMGEIARELEKAAPVNGQGEIPVAQRKAEPADLSTANDNDMRARSALRTAHTLVENLGLGMKLLNAHYSLDGKLVTIQFSADGGWISGSWSRSFRGRSAPGSNCARSASVMKLPFTAESRSADSSSAVAVS